MSPFAGRAIGLVFALLWLLVGGGALPLPWRHVVNVLGVATLVVLAVRAWRMHEERDRLFRMSRYWVAVGAELVALMLASHLLGRAGLNGYLLPVVGIIVGLHFIGLWWAGGGTQFLWLAGTMTAIDAAALLLPPGSNVMQAVVGLGSAAALAGAAASGARR